MHDVPVAIGENAIAVLHGRIEEKLPALLFGSLAADLVRIDHEAERTVALRHAKQVTFVREGQRIGLGELAAHLLEIRHEPRLIERFDQPVGGQTPRPGLIDVENVPNVQFTGAKPIDHVWVGCTAFGAHPRTRVQFTKRPKHIVRVVAFPSTKCSVRCRGPPRLDAPARPWRLRRCLRRAPDPSSCAKASSKFLPFILIFRPISPDLALQPMPPSGRLLDID